MPRIRDIAQICKSKNAGPFMVTIDVLFEDGVASVSKFGGVHVVL